MKTKLILLGLMSAFVAFTTPGCDDDEKEGCTDPNSDNYDSKADINKDCRYRYASNIDISGIPEKDGNGNTWDDGDGPDIKLNFGRKSSTGYEYSTSTVENVAGSTTVIPNSTSIKFTNEDWKFQLIDADVIGSQTIAEGNFNPLKSSSNNVVEVTLNGITYKFKYTIK